MRPCADDTSTALRPHPWSLEQRCNNVVVIRVSLCRPPHRHAAIAHHEAPSASEQSSSTRAPAHALLCDLEAPVSRLKDLGQVTVESVEHGHLQLRPPGQIVQKPWVWQRVLLVAQALLQVHRALRRPREASRQEAGAGGTRTGDSAREGGRARRGRAAGPTGGAAAALRCCGAAPPTCAGEAASTRGAEAAIDSTPCTAAPASIAAVETMVPCWPLPATARRRMRPLGEGAVGAPAPPRDGAPPILLASVGLNSQNIHVGSPVARRQAPRAANGRGVSGLAAHNKRGRVRGQRCSQPRSGSFLIEICMVYRFVEVLRALTL